MKVAVIGGGYAGMAAAVTLAERNVPVTVYEAGKTLGGRARRLEYPQTVLDNGLHILIGAYSETLRLMRQVGIDPAYALLRVPFTWNIHGRLKVTAPALPAPFHLLGGLIAARGVALGKRLSAARFVMAMRRVRFTLPHDMTVALLLERERQDPDVMRLLWRPLCVSALNTPLETASAQIFLNVLRDSLSAHRDASDLLLPRVDLSALFPDPARAWVETRGGTVLAGNRVMAIETAGTGYTIRHAGGNAAYTHVICALPPHQIKGFLAGIPALFEVTETIDRFEYHPIYSVYLRYPRPLRLPSTMLGFDSALLQWAFDRDALCGQAGLVGLVMSSTGAHEEHPHDQLCHLAHQELQQQLGLLPAPDWFRVIAERRATFACVPGLKRPENRTALETLFLAGDYTASEYPATLEAAVRSGVTAARLVLETRN